MMRSGLGFLAKPLMLTVTSFFILFAVSKTDSKKLKSFGNILTITLCSVAVLLMIFSAYATVCFGPYQGKGHGGYSKGGYGSGHMYGKGYYRK